jgi:phage gpG-like protein
MGYKKTLQQALADFRNAKNRMAQLMDRMPAIMGEEGVKVVKENFDLQGYDTGEGFHPWPKRAEVTNKAYDYNRTKKFRTPTGRVSTAKNSYKGSTYSSKNPILQQTRTLKRGITYFPRKRAVKIGVSPSLIVYAQKMNEGGPGKWGRYAATRTPARQFMPRPDQPPNKKILTRVWTKVKFEQDKIMKDFKK